MLNDVHTLFVSNISCESLKEQKKILIKMPGFNVLDIQVIKPFKSKPETELTLRSFPRFMDYKQCIFLNNSYINVQSKRKSNSPVHFKTVIFHMFSNPLKFRMYCILIGQEVEAHTTAEKVSLQNSLRPGLDNRVTLKLESSEVESGLKVHRSTTS